MAEIGTDKRLVRIRVIGLAEMAEPLAEKIVALLEFDGYTVLEWSKPYPCRQPEEADKSRIYVSGRKDATDDHVE